ncbi:putative 39S ribosomal protein L45, mitochondrial [Hypsizygus marmoreus]|uniref:39S ribosomal protein L45, mitochondrial n=1 Tax=Hypsizygus marmoreus TaxID=39966 RepID=A0A369K8H6_HYPMA|nr:putative 39S ribosomal protein L45, mitochondrial [Hypsizygus marmoreus]
MAFAFSRRCIGALCSQSGAGLTLAGPSRVGVCNLNFAARGYAAAAVKQKQKQKKAAPAAGASSKAALSPKSSGKRVAKAATSDATGTSASGRQTSAPLSSKTLKRASGGMSYKVPEKEQKKPQELTEEEQMAQVDQIVAMGKLFPTADPWGQRVDTLDVAIPYSVKPTERDKYPSLGAMWRQFLENRYNGAKNATCLLLLAQADAVPGVDLSEATRVQKFITQWPWRILSATSVKPNSWMEPLRKLALKTYQDLNTALAQQDDKTIKELTTSTYQDHTMHLLKKSRNPNLKYIWRFHGEVTPTRVISIRATEGYLATDDPKFGNRMMVHALVRIDSEQSLEIYDKRGTPLHASHSDDCPVEKRRVTEYLVFEKRMWYDGPWVIREQLWEAPGKLAAV